MSPPYIYQPYHNAHNKTDDADNHITFQFTLSLLDAIHVPRVCTESFAITEYAANKKMTPLKFAQKHNIDHNQIKIFDVLHWVISLK